MDLIRPDWPAPPNVRAASTTRLGGVSAGAFESLNLGDHVGDVLDRVEANRALLSQYLGLSSQPRWLRQVHGCEVARAETVLGDSEADASVTSKVGEVCVVMTADCLPLLLCDQAGRQVAAVHAGWRGLVGGVIERTVAAMDVPSDELLVWLGPAIGPAAFEVGPEVRDAFCASDLDASRAFAPSPSGASEGRHLADIFLLARRRLERLGIERVYGGGECTFSQPTRFFSFRRDAVTGRMASLIWLADTP